MAGFQIPQSQLQHIKPYPVVSRKLPTANDEGWTKVGDTLVRKGIDIIPQLGMQEDVVRCQANLILAAGAATMGKTFSGYLKAAYGLGLAKYSANMISFRLQDVKKGSSILRDAITVYAGYAGCTTSFSDYPTFHWEQWNNSIRFTHSNFNFANPKEREEFEDYAKKVQASYMYIDEVTEMKHIGMLFYWFTRNRDDSSIKPCIYCTFNPKHEHWTTDMLVQAGYIGDDWYIKKEMIGVLSYFYVAGDGDKPEDITWGKTKQEVLDKVGHLIHISDKEKAYGVTKETMVKSFTVFTGEAADNLELVSATGGQSIANLHVGGKNKAALKEGYFGVIENEELNVTRQMINNLPINPKSDDDNMYATLDISECTETSDEMPMIIWRGLDIIAIKMLSVNPRELVDAIQMVLNEYRVPIANFAFDATGMGTYLKYFTSGWGITANRKPIQEIDASGNPVLLEQYYNIRSQLLGRTKVLLEKGDISCSVSLDMTLPYGKRQRVGKELKQGTRTLRSILYDEMNVFVVQSLNKRIYYRSKDEYRAKFKGSPNIMDSIALRAVFELDARPKKQPAEEWIEEDYDGLYSEVDEDDDFGGLYESDDGEY